MFLKRPVHIVRKGTIIGEYSSVDLESLLAEGELLPTDVCYIEENSLWINLPDYIRSTALPKFQPQLDPQIADPEEKSTGPEWSLAPGDPVTALLGWIAFLIALAALAGTIIWIVVLKGELRQARDLTAAAELKLYEQDKAYRKRTAPPLEENNRLQVSGTVRLTEETGEKVTMPAFSVQLYKRKEIEDYLHSKSLDLAAMKHQLNSDMLSNFLNGIPSPLKKTTTDAFGKYAFVLPEKGQYVVYSSMTVPSGTGSARVLLWFVSFSTDDPLNLPVNITESNRSTQFIPELMVISGR